MEVDEAVMVAGIGCRKNTAPGEILAAIDAALAAHALERPALDALATAWLKGEEPGIQAAARHLDLPLIVVAAQDLQRASSRGISNSAASLAASGAGSASEAAALAAAGAESRLLGPRLVAGNVTCAIAIGKGEA